MHGTSFTGHFRAHAFAGPDRIGLQNHRMLWIVSDDWRTMFSGLVVTGKSHVVLVAKTDLLQVSRQVFIRFSSTWSLGGQVFRFSSCFISQTGVVGGWGACWAWKAIQSLSQGGRLCFSE